MTVLDSWLGHYELLDVCCKFMTVCNHWILQDEEGNSKTEGGET